MIAWTIVIMQIDSLVVMITKNTIMCVATVAVSVMHSYSIVVNVAIACIIGYLLGHSLRRKGIMASGLSDNEVIPSLIRNSAS